MNRYVMEFSKTGRMRYISHLDLLRLFNRAFKRSDIRLTHSKGFNPHPSIRFAQPLSLGYEGLREVVEFELDRDMKPDEIVESMSGQMPEGIEILSCIKEDEARRSLAALTVSAEYLIIIPLEKDMAGGSDTMNDRFISQETISGIKKKKNKITVVDIKPMIRKLSMTAECNELKIKTEIDAGSVSNLNPEILIDSMLKFFDIDVKRENISVSRLRTNFLNK